MVETIAKDMYKSLSSKNTFKPLVLAKVSHNNNWFVGFSISVSPFLRPLCLFKRISGFKFCLMKAIIHGEPLTVSDNQKMNWSCSAFRKKEKDYKVKKDPCQKCQKMFKNLEGFISESTNKESADDHSYLGACAEYCPVNELLEDDEQALSESDNLSLKANREQCLKFYYSFGVLAKTCNAVFRSLEDTFENVRDILHIFGFKPDRNFDNSLI